MNGMATRHAPDVRIPLVHLLTGVVAALGGGLVLLWQGPELLRQPLGDLHTLALTHVFTLGWLAMTLMGASYQLVPVLLQVRLPSERLAAAGYPLLAAGAALLVAGFATAHPLLLAVGGALAATALLAHAGHIAATVLRARARPVQRVFFLASAACLALVAVLGSLMAADLRWGFLRVDLLPTHVLAALVGWTALLAIGAAYRLVPMFTLSHGPAENGGLAVAVLLLAAALLLPLRPLLPAPVAALCALPLPVAAGLFLLDQRRLFRARLRAHLDTGMRLSVAGFGYLGLTALAAFLDLAGLVHLPPATLVVLALLGWLGCLIAGQTYKIVPFLVWFRRYARGAGTERVPLLREMYDERLARLGMWSLVAAGLLLAAGTTAGSGLLLRVGALGWVVGYGVLAANMLQVLRA